MKEPSNSERTILLCAFNQNWLHVRHIEGQRLQLFYFYTTIVVAITTISTLVDSSDFITIIILLYFLSLASLFIFSAFIKMNIEIRNHMAATQWISEKLKLINKMEDKDKLVSCQSCKVVRDIRYVLHN